MGATFGITGVQHEFIVIQTPAAPFGFEFVYRFELRRNRLRCNAGEVEQTYTVSPCPLDQVPLYQVIAVDVFFRL
jgi:hypothetical protein